MTIKQYYQNVKFAKSINAKIILNRDTFNAARKGYDRYGKGKSIEELNQMIKDEWTKFNNRTFETEYQKSRSYERTKYKCELIEWAIDAIKYYKFPVIEEWIKITRQ